MRINFNKTQIYENNISDLIYCNMVEYKKCKNCEDNKCSLILCGKETLESDKTIFEKYEDVCIPNNISNEEKNEICLNFNGVNSYRSFNECNSLNYQFYYISSSIYLIIIIIVLLIFMIIIFYNKYLITNEAKPFNVPIIFTETFFPNINDKDNEHQKLENNESTNSPNIYGKYQNL